LTPAKEEQSEQGKKKSTETGKKNGKNRAARRPQEEED
jgi:hypothetical protein